MNWNAEQQRLLQALGHELMVHRVGGALVGAAPTKAAPAVVGNKLVEAIRRAAGGHDVSALIDDIGRLRNEPALKRALWPRLRALRRSH